MTALGFDPGAAQLYSRLLPLTGWPCMAVAATLSTSEGELKEEAGFGARRLELLTELSLSPGYMSQKIQVVLARDLYPEQLPGDEPEPMRLEQVSLHELSSLVQHPQFSEGRALAALYLARDLLTQRGEFGQ